MKRLPSSLNKPELKKAIGMAAVMNLSEDEREVYENHLKWLRMEASTLLSVADKERQAGIVEGEKKKAQEIAPAMLQSNIFVDQVSKITRLTVQEVSSLKAIHASPIAAL